MADEFAPLNLRARLSALQDRIAQARTKLEAHGAVEEHSEALTQFANQHDAIRGSLDSEATMPSSDAYVGAFGSIFGAVAVSGGKV